MNKLQNLSTTMKVVLIGSAACVGFFLLMSLILISSFVGTRNHGISAENNLSALYKQSVSIRDKGVQNFFTGMGIKTEQNKQVKDILVATAEGRYKPGSAAEAAKGGNGSALFSAIQEAYPNLDMANYDKVLAQFQDDNAAFQTQQQKMASALTAYRNWKDSGVLTPIWTHTLLHLPSDRLMAAKGGKVLHGQAALDQMDVVIQSSETQKNFDTGIAEPLSVNK